jgi:hypothetical protein
MDDPPLLIMIFGDFEVVSLGLQRLMTTDVYGRNFFLYCLVCYQQRLLELKN